MKPLLGQHRIDLVGGHAVGEHGVKIERCPDRLRRRGAIAGHHDEAGDTGRAQHADGMRRLGAQFVGEQQGADVRPSTATNSTSAERQEARRHARTPIRPGWRGENQVGEPALTRLPSMTPAIPGSHRLAQSPRHEAADRGQAPPPRPRRPAHDARLLEAAAPRCSTRSAFRRRRLDRKQARAADGQRASLVE